MSYLTCPHETLLHKAFQFFEFKCDPLTQLFKMFVESDLKTMLCSIIGKFMFSFCEISIKKTKKKIPYLGGARGGILENFPPTFVERKDG